MNIYDHLGLWIVGLVMAGFALHLCFRRVNPQSRVMRKRRRNYGKVIAKANRPVVMLNAKTEKS